MTPTNFSKRQRKLYRQARHQVIQAMEKQYSPFDREGNVVGDERPQDFKTYWANLSDTERAFERLQRTDAAVYMEFCDLIRKTLPPDVSADAINPTIIYREIK